MKQAQNKECAKTTHPHINLDKPTQRVKEVALLMGGVSPSYIWNKCNPHHKYYDADFPKPFKLSKQVTVWHTPEVLSYVHNRMTR